MQVGQTKHGMLTMNQSLAELVRKRQITADEAVLKSPEPEELRGLLTSGVSASAPRTR